MMIPLIVMWILWMMPLIVMWILYVMPLIVLWIYGNDGFSDCHAYINKDIFSSDRVGLLH
jgi:hypothetical protein